MQIELGIFEGEKLLVMPGQRWDNKSGWQRL